MFYIGVTACDTFTSCDTFTVCALCLNISSQAVSTQPKGYSSGETGNPHLEGKSLFYQGLGERFPELAAMDVEVDIFWVEKWERRMMGGTTGDLHRVGKNKRQFMSRRRVKLRHETW